MKKTKQSFRLALCSALTFFVSPMAFEQSVQAQCCWASRSPNPYPVGNPYPVANPAQAGSYSAGRPMIPVTPITPSNGALTSYYGNYGMLPPTTGNALPNGFPQTVTAAMPTAGYDTQWQRTPVTYYRPVTQYDPNYGTTVTSLQPCTSYQYQAQRVPVIAPTPIGGAYAQASNQWPAINQPGYYPTGAANAYTMMPAPLASASTATPVPTAPVYPQVQYLPAAGTTVQAGANIPTIGTAAPSTGLQANTGTGLSNAVYYGNPSLVPGSPSTAANCPGGNCPTNLTPPNVPGATSVTPMGPVTYLPAQPNAAPTGATQATALQPGAQLPNNSGLVLPPSGATLDPASAVAPSLPPPPTSSFTPGSTSSPTSGTSQGTGTNPIPATVPSTSLVPANPTAPSISTAGLWSDRDERVSKMVPMSRLPVVPIDRPAASTAPSFPTSSSVPSDPAAIANPFPGSSSRTPLAPPSLLPNPSSTNQPSAKPLVAPEGFDGKPHWNPKLLPPAPRSPEDNVALRTTAAVK